MTEFFVGVNCFTFKTKKIRYSVGDRGTVPADLVRAVTSSASLVSGLLVQAEGSNPGGSKYRHSFPSRANLSYVGTFFLSINAYKFSFFNGIGPPD
jgi:hypothetical protein